MGYWGKVGQNAVTGEELTNGAWQSGAFGAIGAAAGELIPAGVSKLRSNGSIEGKSAIPEGWIQLADGSIVATPSRMLQPAGMKVGSFAGDEAVQHFSRHGNEVKQVLQKSSYHIKEYLDDARLVIQTGQYVPEMSGYVKIVGGKGSAKAAFVGVRRDDQTVITTFHFKSVKEISKKAPSLGWDFK